MITYSNCTLLPPSPGTREVLGMPYERKPTGGYTGSRHRRRDQLCQPKGSLTMAEVTPDHLLCVVKGDDPSWQNGVGICAKQECPGIPGKGIYPKAKSHSGSLRPFLQATVPIIGCLRSPAKSSMFSGLNGQSP